MTEPKFTPGPWLVAEEAKIKHPEGTLIAQAQYWPDAHLIAAAPELYEALEELYAEQKRPPLEKYKTSWEKAIRKTEAALAKARGEA